MDGLGLFNDQQCGSNDRLRSKAVNQPTEVVNQREDADGPRPLFVTDDAGEDNQRGEAASELVEALTVRLELVDSRRDGESPSASIAIGRFAVLKGIEAPV